MLFECIEVYYHDIVGQYSPFWPATKRFLAANVFLVAAVKD
jgi:hypothetical protein